MHVCVCVCVCVCVLRLESPCDYWDGETRCKSANAHIIVNFDSTYIINGGYKVSVV